MRPALAFLLIFSASAGFAQGDLSLPGGPPLAAPPVTISGAVHSRSGERVEGSISVTIPETWHINSAVPVDEFAIPTALSFNPATLAEPAVRYPQHQLKSFQFTAGKPIAVFEGKLTIPFTGTVKGESIAASLRYQACNDRVCLPPKEATASFPAAPTGGGAPPAPGSASASGFTPLSAAPRGAATSGNDRLARTFAASGLPLTLAVLFVLGMALNLTPCVFPMIPITLGFFAMQSDGRRGRRFALSAFYVLGLVVMYSSLGVVAALGGKMFGAWLQRPAMQVGFALLMLVLASSMFGAFDIGVPRFIANRATGRAGLAGAATMGLLVGIVAAPCVGPVVVSLITLVANIGKPSIGFVMFAALALGLGFPYLVMLNALPKPGEWMVQVKKAMGFVLIAMAIFFLRPLVGEILFRWGVAGSLLIGAAFLFISRSQSGQVMRLACASLLLIAGAAFAIPRGSGVALQWTPYEVRAVSAAAAIHKPAIIDFYADWCIPCKELDEKTFRDPRVAAELQQFARIKADLTRAEDDKTRELTSRYSIVGVPTIVLLDSSGRELTALRLTGFEGPDEFLKRLEQVK